MTVFRWSSERLSLTITQSSTYSYFWVMCPRINQMPLQFRGAFSRCNFKRPAHEYSLERLAVPNVLFLVLYIVSMSCIILLYTPWILLSSVQDKTILTADCWQLHPVAILDLCLSNITTLDHHLRGSSGHQCWRIQGRKWCNQEFPSSNIWKTLNYGKRERYNYFCHRK